MQEARRPGRANLTVRIRDVARHAGVSIATVSNAINKPHLVSKSTRQRVEEAVRDLGFVPNASAQQLRTGESNTIALLVPDVTNPFYADVFKGAERGAIANNLTILLGNLDNDPSRERRYVDLFCERGAKGLVWISVGKVVDGLEFLRERQVPLVVVGHRELAKLFPSAYFDNVAGGYLATKHLAHLGRRRIAFVGAVEGVPQIADRLVGASRAVAETTDVTLDLVSVDGLDMQGGREAARRILVRDRQTRPDAIFAANDLIAIGLMQALMLSGTVRIPEDIAVVGYDDNMFAQSAIVPLTTIRTPGVALGEAAMKLLLEEFQRSGGGARSEVLDPELIVRQSTAGQAPSG